MIHLNGNTAPRILQVRPALPPGTYTIRECAGPTAGLDLWKNISINIIKIRKSGCSVCLPGFTVGQKTNYDNASFMSSIHSSCQMLEWRTLQQHTTHVCEYSPFWITFSFGVTAFDTPSSEELKQSYCDIKTCLWVCACMIILFLTSLPARCAK
jgi:hypothetical protein